MGEIKFIQDKNELPIACRGRNGAGICTGIEIEDCTGIEIENCKDIIQLRPISTRGLTYACRIPIPKKHLQEFINQLISIQNAETKV